ncbi:MAG: amidohydrolase family protein [bacterium]
MQQLLIKNATIVDGTGSDPKPNGGVLVSNGKIQELWDGPVKKSPAKTQVINAKGQWLLPGLIDAHVHMGAVDVDIRKQQREMYPSLLLVRTLKVLEETLEQGFTTVRDAGGVDPGLREALRQGLIKGPRLLVSGPALSQTGGHGDFRVPAEQTPPLANPAGLCTWVCDGVEMVRKATRELLRQGVDQIKVMAAGGAMSPADELEQVQFTPEELKAIVWEAKAAGKYVMAHVYSTKSILHALAAGVRSLEHGNLLDQEAASAIKAAGAFLVPTLATYEALGRMGQELGIPKENMRKIHEARERSLEALSIAHKAGVDIASGSDLLGPMQSQKALELELKAKVLGPMGAIVASTSTNARLLGLEGQVGTIEPGKLADLILVDGDPLKDIRVLQHYHKSITLILQGGRIVKNLL